MHKRHDQLSKRIARELFDPLCSVTLEKEGAVPESVRSALLAVGDASRLDALLPVFVNGSTDDIARALLS